MNRIRWKKRIPELFLVFLMLGACAPAYVPNVVNTPMLSNKGELQVGAYTGISGFDPQVAYAVSNNVGVMVNGSFANQTSDTTNNFHKHNFLELGAGYYTFLGNHGRFEVFGGYGFGNVNGLYENEAWSSRASVNTNRVFIQPSVGATTSFFDGSISSRIVYVNLAQEAERSSGMFVEPVITGKLGFDYFKVVMQMGFSMPLDQQVHFNYQPFMFSIGLHAKIWKINE